MRDLRGALDEIAQMRGLVARSSQFKGLGPATLTATGLMALFVGATQGFWLPDPVAHAGAFVVEWYATALCALLVIGVEGSVRARREHGCMAIPLIQQAARHFCPTLIAGGLVTVALLHAEPGTSWLLPGLWEVIFSLGAFAMAPMLPKPMFAVGVWYLLCGLICIQLGPTEALSGWTMGIPFGVGQILVAGILVARNEQGEIDD